MVFVHFVLRAVIMAGEHDPARAHPVEQGAPVGVPVQRAQGGQLHDAALDGGRVRALAAAHGPVAVEIGILADAGAVIHQADHAHPPVVRHRVEQRHQVGGGQFAAQMEEVVAFQQPGTGQGVAIRHAVQEGADAVLLETEIAQAQRIQHRGHAGGGALRVMRDHGRAGGPARIAAWVDLALQVVGVHVHHARNQVIPVQVERGRLRAAPLHLRDGLPGQHHGAVDDGAGQHDAGVGEAGHGSVPRGSGRGGCKAPRHSPPAACVQSA